MSKYSTSSHGARRCFAQCNPVPALLECHLATGVQCNQVKWHACLRTQSHNEAQDLLLLQDYVHRLTNTLRTLEDTHAALQQTDLLAGVINEQDC